MLLRNGKMKRDVMKICLDFGYLGFWGFGVLGFYLVAVEGAGGQDWFVEVWFVPILRIQIMMQPNMIILRTILNHNFRFLPPMVPSPMVELGQFLL